MCPAQLCVVRCLAPREPLLGVTAIAQELTQPQQVHKPEETGLSKTAGCSRPCPGTQALVGG